MNNIRIVTLLLSLLYAFFLNAQELTVKSFTLSGSEIISSKDRRNDLTGQPCALLKIQMVDQLDKVEGNVIGNVVDRGTEKWVYVTDGTYQLRIYPKNHLPITLNIKEKNYGVNQMESNRVYILRLTEESRKEEAQKEHAYLKLKLSPETAMVTIDGKAYDDEPEDGWIYPLLKYGQHIIEVRARGYVTRTDTIDIRGEKQLEILLQRQTNPSVTIRSATPEAKIYVNNVEYGRGECTLELSPRDYMVKIEQEGYETLESPITVTEKEKQLFPMPALKELLGSLNVKFKPVGSQLTIDGKSYGTTPTIVNQLSAGIHSVMVSKEGYKSYFNNTLKIEPDQENTLSGKLERLPESKEEDIKPVILDNAPVRSTDIASERGRSVDIASKSKPKSSLLSATCGYASAGAQVGSLMGLCFSAGCYISNFNIEASYGMGLSKSEDIYWNSSSNPEESPILCNYKPTLYSLRLGYGIAAGRSLRLTPQVGTAIVSLKADGSKANATTATIGLRAELAVMPHLSLYATPEIGFAVSKSNVCQQLIDVSSQIKSWTGGFNCCLGLCVSF